MQLTDSEIKDDIGIKNGILRKRFIRELKELKKTADYTSCDGGITANFLARVGPEYRGYTYSLIQGKISLFIMWKSKTFLRENFLRVIYKWSVAGELSLDLMQRLSAADLEDMLKVTPPSTYHFHHDEDCRLESALVPS